MPTSSAKRVVLATAGSLGDLNPYIAIGVGLKAAGHHVTIATSQPYRKNVEQEGLHFHVLRPNLAPVSYTPDIFKKANDLRSGTQYLMQEMVARHVDQTYEDLLAACTGADLLIFHRIVVATPLVVEKLKIKWISVALAPCAFESAYDPPLMPPLPWLHALRHFGPLPSRCLFKFLRRYTRGWMKPVDDLRDSLGLPPAEAHPLHDGMVSPFATLACFSPVMGARQPDWPSNAHFTGFTMYDEPKDKRVLDRSLEDFLAEGEPPVVFTLGSSAVIDPGNFYEASLEAMERVGCRAVLLTGSNERNLPKAYVPPHVFVVESAPYSALFGRAAAVVHQGGIGTTAQALKAGIPMLVVPFLHDQPDNAFRLKRLGVARIVKRSKYSARLAADNLKALLSDPRYRLNAQAAAAQVRAQDGVANACRVIEGVLNGQTGFEPNVQDDLAGQLASH